MSGDLTKKLPKSDSDKLTLILTTVQTLDVRVGNLERRVDNFDSRLQILEQKVEERLYETRPIWQKVVADIAQLREGQQRLEDGLVVLRTEVHAMRRDVHHRFSVLNDTMLAIQADHRDVHERVSRLEADRNPPNSST